jgi:SAM-dependent methyltransferase
VSLATSQHSGATEGQLWSARALDWADYQEVQFHDLYTAVLGSTRKLAGQRLLDVGCGTGTLLRRATKHGAIATGLDAATGMVQIARRRVPDPDIRIGELERLPFGPGSFDIVTGVNVFDLARDPLAAVIEARRVLRPEGTLVATTWGAPERCDATRLMTAVRALMPPKASTPGPGDPSVPAALAELATAAGLTDVREYDADCIWRYDDESTLLRGLMSAGPLVLATAHSGAYAVTSAILRAVKRHRTSDGGYTLHNVFRLVTATAPPLHRLRSVA